MKATIKIEYSAERDETAEDEQRLLDIMGEELKSYVASIRTRAEAAGLSVDVST